MIKFALDKTNNLLVRYNSSSTPSLWQFWHRWNYQHSLIKNILIFANRFMKGINKYHIFRWDWMVGVAGAFTAFLVSSLQQLYYQIKIGYKPTTSHLLIQGVLKNKGVSNKLNQVLEYNVFRNTQLQYYMHQAILNQVIHPHRQNIKSLMKIGVKSLHQKQNLDSIAILVADNLHILKEPIKVNALTFLKSPTLDRIVANGLKYVLESLFFKQFLADQLNNVIKSQLKDSKNSEYLYELIRQRISF